MCEANLDSGYLIMAVVGLLILGSLARQAGNATERALRRYVERTCRQERSDDQPHQPES